MFYPPFTYALLVAVLMTVAIALTARIRSTRNDRARRQARRAAARGRPQLFHN